MTRTWFTSDLHLGHRLVSGLRGFTDADGSPVTDEHDASVEQVWRETVDPGDTVFVLGDLSLKSSPTGLSAVLDTIASWPGTKHLILGNHDPGHPMHSRARQLLPLYSRVFATVATAGTITVGRTPMLMSHFPYLAQDGFESRFPQWRLPDCGGWLLHGHTHGPERLHGREVHVGWDAWSRPVATDELAALLEQARR